MKNHAILFIMHYLCKRFIKSVREKERQMQLFTP